MLAPAVPAGLVHTIIMRSTLSGILFETVLRFHTKRSLLAFFHKNMDIGLDPYTALFNKVIINYFIAS